MTSLQKRSVLPLALASALALTVLPVSAPAHAAEGDTGTLTVLATTDVHGRVYNWDYFKDSAPAPAPGAVTPGKGKGAALANTGSDAMGLILAAGLLAGLGAVALRRRAG